MRTPAARESFPTAHSWFPPLFRRGIGSPLPVVLGKGSGTIWCLVRTTLAKAGTVAAAVAAASLFVSAQSGAAETLLLASGKTLEVETVEFTEDGVRVELPAGGKLLLPFEAVDSVLEEAPGRTPALLPEAVPFRDEILKASRHHGVDPVLVTALIQVESAFDPNAISDQGACGLMQLLPETARDYGVDEVFDPAANLEAGVRHLRRLLDRYQNDPVLALAAYNAGEGRVDRHGGVPPYRETRDYVARVTALLEDWTGPDPPVR